MTSPSNIQKGYSESPFYYELLSRLLGASLKKVYPCLPLFGGSINEEGFYFDCKNEFFTPHPDLHSFLKESMLGLWKKKDSFTLLSMMQENAILFLKSKKQDDIAEGIAFSEENVVQLLEMEGLYFQFPNECEKQDWEELLERDSFPFISFEEPLFYEREEVLYIRFQGKVKERKGNKKQKPFPFFEKEEESSLTSKGVWDRSANVFFNFFEDIQEKWIKKNFPFPFYPKSSFSIPFEGEKKEFLFLEEAVNFYKEKNIKESAWIYRDYIRFFAVNELDSWEELQKTTFKTPLYEVQHAELNAFFYKGKEFTEGFHGFVKAVKDLKNSLAGHSEEVSLLYSLKEQGKKRREKPEIEQILAKENIPLLEEFPWQVEGSFAGNSLKIVIWIQKGSLLKVLSTFEIITDTKIFKERVPYEIGLFSLMGSKERFLNLIWELNEEIPSFFHPTPLQFILIGQTGKIEEQLFARLVSYKIPYTLSFGEGKIGELVETFTSKRVPCIAVITDKERSKGTVSFCGDKKGVETLPWEDFALLMKNRLTFIGEESLESQ